MTWSSLGLFFATLVLALTFLIDLAQLAGRDHPIRRVNFLFAKVVLLAACTTLLLAQWGQR